MRCLVSFSAALLMAAGVLAVPAAATDMEGCRSGKFEDRIPACTRAIASRKFKGENLALLYAERGRAYFFAERDYDRAIADYNQALRIRPKDDIFAHDSVFAIRAEAFRGKGELDRAIADLTQALRIHSGHYIIERSVYFWRAESYKDKGDLDRAIADYGELIKLDKKFLDPFYRRGVLYHKKGDLDRAIADYSEAIEANPKHAPSFAARALAYQKKGEAARAKEDFTRALGLSTEGQSHDGEDTKKIAERGLAALTETPSPPVAAVTAPAGTKTAPPVIAPATPPTPAVAAADDQKTCAEHDKARFDESIAACTRLIASGTARGQELARLLFSRGLRYLGKRENDPALADFSESIRLDPSNWIAYRVRGEIHHRKNDYDRAIADLDEAIRRKPDDDYAFILRGNSYLKKPDFDRALADFDAASRLNPRFLRAHVGRSEIYENRGELGKALAEIRSALAFEPTSKFLQETAQRIEQKLAATGEKVPVQAAAPSPAPVAPAVPAPPAPQISPAPAHPPVAALPQPSPPVAVAAEKRVALVIGNANYRAVGKLQNPPRDAAALADGLRRVGFKTVQLTSDLTREGMIAALRTFEREAERADWAVVYFAGHGIEVGGVNYLVPVDAQLKADKDVLDEAVPLDRVLSAIESAKKLRLVILDACRDNPFIATMKRSIASRAIGRGLAQIEPEGGVLVAYAAKHGQVALDGEGANSPFVTALVKRLDTPGLDISLLFRLVRDDVLAATGRRQEPFVYGSLPGELLSFRPR
jgi:tetratricopeptide (TPR) repeat protein